MFCCARCGGFARSARTYVNVNHPSINLTRLCSSQHTTGKASRMDQEEGGSLAAASAAWLEACCQAQLAALQPGGCLALELDVVDLAAGQQHAAVVEALLEDPGALLAGIASPSVLLVAEHGAEAIQGALDARWPPPPADAAAAAFSLPRTPSPPAEQLRQAVIATLAEADLLPPGLRVWLRPRQLPAAAEPSVPEALECMRCAPGALFSCHGTCIAATAPFQQPAVRAFQCAACAKVCTLHSLEAPPPCCGAGLCEVEQARVMVQVGAGRCRWVLGAAPSERRAHHVGAALHRCMHSSSPPAPNNAKHTGCPLAFPSTHQLTGHHTAPTCRARCCSWRLMGPCPPAPRHSWAAQCWRSA